MLYGRTSEGDKIGALDVGADDYVTKPFAMAELIARLRAALRRDEAEMGRDQPRQATVGRWLVDLTAHQVRRRLQVRNKVLVLGWYLGGPTTSRCVRLVCWVTLKGRMGDGALRLLGRKR